MVEVEKGKGKEQRTALAAGKRETLLPLALIIAVILRMLKRISSVKLEDGENNDKEKETHLVP
jgi:hypothetical protein